MPKTLKYTGDDAIPQNDAWAETLTIDEALVADGTAVAMTVPDRARIALYADRAKTAAAVLNLDSEAGADGLITLAQVGDTFTVSWAPVLALDLGTYYGDLQLDWDDGEPRSPWTIADIILQVGRDYAG